MPASSVMARLRSRGGGAKLAGDAFRVSIAVALAIALAVFVVSRATADPVPTTTSPPTVTGPAPTPTATTPGTTPTPTSPTPTSPTGTQPTTTPTTTQPAAPPGGDAGDDEQGLTQSVVGFLIRVQNFPETDPALQKLEGGIKAIALGLLGVVLTISVMRYWIMGLSASGRGGSEFVEGLVRTVFVGFLISVWPFLWNHGTDLANDVVNSIINLPVVVDQSGNLLINLFSDAAIGGGLAALLSGGTLVLLLAIVVALMLLGIVLFKVSLIAAGMIVFAGMPVALLLYPLGDPLRTAASAAKVAVAVWVIPIVWAVIFAVMVVMGPGLVGLGGGGQSIPAEILKPIVGIVLLGAFIAVPRSMFKAATGHGGAGGGGFAGRAMSFAAGRAMAGAMGNAVTKGGLIGRTIGNPTTTTVSTDAATGRQRVTQTETLRGRAGAEKRASEQRLGGLDRESQVYEDQVSDAADQMDNIMRESERADQRARNVRDRAAHDRVRSESRDRARRVREDGSGHAANRGSANGATRPPTQHVSSERADHPAGGPSPGPGTGAPPPGQPGDTAGGPVDTSGSTTRGADGSGGGPIPTSSGNATPPAAGSPGGGPTPPPRPERGAGRDAELGYAAGRSDVGHPDAVVAFGSLGRDDRTTLRDAAEAPTWTGGSDSPVTRVREAAAARAGDRATGDAARQHWQTLTAAPDDTLRNLLNIDSRTGGDGQ